MVEHFLKFEDENNLFARNIKGFYYWAYIRFEVYTGLFEHRSKYITPLKVKDIITMVKLALFRNSKRIYGTTDILAMGYPRKIFEKGILKDPYIGPIVENERFTSVVLERYSRMFALSNDEKIVYLQDAELKVKLYRKLLNRKTRNKIDEEIDYLSKIVKDSFCMILNKNEIRNKLISDYSMWCIYQDVYRKILTKIKPKCIIETPGYASHNQVLNEVSKELMIPTIEIEHGFILESHVPYNFYRKMTIKSFPDYIFVGSDYQKKYPRFPIDKDHIKVVGSPFLEERVKKRTTMLDEHNILIVGGVSYSIMLANFVDKLVDYLRKNKKYEYTISYKVHPKDYSHKYIDMGIKYPEINFVIGTNGKSLYDCLETAGIVIGFFTSSLFEAQAFGARVYILRGDTNQEFSRMVEDGYMAFIEEPEEIFEKKNFSLKPLWKLNAMDSTLNEISKIIERNE